MNYRHLTEFEITALQNQSCSADNWGSILVTENFTTTYIYSTNFSGEIRMGCFDGTFNLPGGLIKHAGIKNACLHNVTLGDNCCIENIHNFIVNYNIGDNVHIQNVEQIYVEGESTFGNAVEVSVLNETGGREVLISDMMSSHFAYILSFYRHRPILKSKLQCIVKRYAESVKSRIGNIGDNSKILNSGTIKNVNIGAYTKIEGAKYLDNGSLNSNFYDPIHIGCNVILKDFIVSSGSKIEDGTMLTRCFVGQACQLGHTYSASDSLFFSNCQGENGEACAIFAGPYTVTHHKSTLLIAGMYSFMNAGSGSNQSNHMYKLGPIHQGIMERGSKTTSDSYILWPAKIGAFSLVMGRHYRNPDTSKMPFSYLIESDDETVLIPGINLRSVGTIRDAQKFPKRDNRNDPNRLDQINFNLLSPFTIQKMFQAIEVLTNLQKTCGRSSPTYTYKSCKIKSSSLKKGLEYYHIAINKFLGNSLISRLESKEWNSNIDIRRCLQPDDREKGLGQWNDLSGLLVPGSEINLLLDSIEQGKMEDIVEINHTFKNLHENYYSMEWTWAWDKIQSYYNVNPEQITARDIIHIIERWKESVVTLDRMIYEDARKEFSLPTHTSFGLDGNKDDRVSDFEQVRGVFEKNPFVEAVLKHIETKTQLGNLMIKRLEIISH